MTQSAAAYMYIMYQYVCTLFVQYMHAYTYVHDYVLVTYRGQQQYECYQVPD